MDRAFEQSHKEQRLNTSLVAFRKNCAASITKDLVEEKIYRQITCLNTSYKLLADIVGKYIREHAMKINIWDEGQLGAVVGVLTTIDQLIIDKSKMEEVKIYQRNLAVAFYDYRRAYDKVRQDWILI